MARFLKNKKLAIGQAPGELIYIGKAQSEVCSISMMDYNPHSLKEKKLDSLHQARELLRSDSVTWVQVSGLQNKEIIREAGSLFHIHPLLLEDIMNTAQRPKLEITDEYLFFSFKILRYDDSVQKSETEQMSVILGANYLLTFQESSSELFSFLKERIRNNVGRIRTSGPDYLAYVVLDSIVDRYLYTISEIGSHVEEMEEYIVSDSDSNTLGKLNRLKIEMNYLRKSIRPFKEIIMDVNKVDSPLFSKDLHPFLRDLMDLSVLALESVTTYQEILSDYLNICQTALNNRLNEIMRILTVFSALFIPLTFIAGIYGTNFEYLPELKYKYSYFIFLGLLFFIALSMILYFKKKKWL